MRIVHQFNVTSEDNSEVMDKAEKELRDLVEGLDIEEAAAQREWEEGENEDEDDDDDDVNSWNKECANMSVADRDELDESTRPVRMLLVKVSLEYNMSLPDEKDLHVHHSFEKYLSH